jgi:tRNA A-37 threonylcarbamoyl transferase component Bud32
VSDAAVAYHEIFRHSKGDILLMDAHQRTLKNVIDEGVELNNLEWMVIMFGLFNCLAKIHERGFVHGDLKPSNGTR